MTVLARDKQALVLRPLLRHSEVTICYLLLLPPPPQQEQMQQVNGAAISAETDAKLRQQVGSEMSANAMPAGSRGKKAAMSLELVARSRQRRCFEVENGHFLSLSGELDGD